MPARHPGPPAERTFYCRTCGQAARACGCPRAGISSSGRPAGRGGPRLGLYCRLDCLWEARDVLSAGDREHTRRGGRPVDPVRDRARVVETAETLLHRGVSVRRVAETLDVDRRQLEHWLTEAGLITPTPTVAASADAATAAVSGLAAPAARDVTARIDEGLAAGTPSVSLAHELVQIGAITALTWSHVQDGPSHEPRFTATVTTTVDEKPCGGTGTAATKASARTAAAEDLLARLR